MSPDELASLRSNNKLPKGPISHDEAASLAELMDQRIKDYPTTLEADTIALSDLQKQPTTDTFRRRRTMAIQVRQGEKQILKQLVETLLDYASQGRHDRANKRAGDELASGKELKRHKT